MAQNKQKKEVTYRDDSDSPIEEEEIMDPKTNNVR